MSSLSVLLNDARSETSKSLRNAESLNASHRVLRHDLNQIERQYLESCTASEARIATSVFAALRPALETPLAVTVEMVEPSDVDGETASTGGQNNIAKIALFAALVAVLGLLFVMLFLERAWLSFAITCVLTVLLTGLTMLVSNKRSLVIKDSQQSKTESVLRFDANALLNRIGQAFDTVEGIVRTVKESRPAVGRKTLESEHIWVVELCQDLLSGLYTNDQRDFVSAARRVPQQLRLEGLRVLTHAEVAETPEVSADSLFEFDPIADGHHDEPQTVYPAIMRGERVIRKGRVLRPA